MSTVLRQAIIDSRMSHKAIEAATGVQRLSIGRFVKGRQSLWLDTADKPAAYFGIESIWQREKG